MEAILLKGAGKHAKEAWRGAEKVIHASCAHPFNKELALGTLDAERFRYYIAQDYAYIQVFSRCLWALSARVDARYSPVFVEQADLLFVEECLRVHRFFLETLPAEGGDEDEEARRSPAFFGYTHYLMKSCWCDPVEVAVAAVLPCFWVYYEIGQWVVQNADSAPIEAHPFQRWIDAYASAAFRKGVENMLEVYEAYAERASSSLRHHMTRAFYHSVVWELRFWDDAYHQRLFVPL